MKKTKLIGIFVSVILLLGAVSAAYAGTDNAQSNNYKDLKSSNWAYAAVNAMSQKGIVKGYSDGSFKPGNTVTYGEFIKMALIAATGNDVGNSTTGNWAKNYYDKAIKLGYFGETDIKVNQLDNEIPRGDMALIISNVLGKVNIKNYDELDKSVKDVDSTTKNDYDIIKVFASGIITGYDDGTFKPEGTLTRAESATVIYRFTDESKRVVPGGVTVTTSSAVSTNGELKATGNIADIVDMSTLPNQVYNDALKITKEYVLVNAADYHFKMLAPWHDNDSCSFNHDIGYAAIYTVKDGKIIEACQTGGMFDIDSGKFLGNYYGISHHKLDDIDYFMAISVNDDTLIKLIKNPFKTK